MTRRGTIFEDAFEAIGIAGYVFGTTPEEQASAARKLDAMMSEWEGEGIALGYTDTDGQPFPEDAMTTPAYADNAIALNLAIKLAPGFGKQVAPSVKGDAKRAYGLVVAKTINTPTSVPPRVQISGGGDRWRRWLLP